ncbi:MAG: hypothetical protein ATN33_00355 [Epulopiscium sp. Nele67-Bin001]|nr:MAG: hypothetical protein ATN33_00355 [Epulopiscium sp. Nele67-Bin001]
MLYTNGGCWKIFYVSGLASYNKQFVQDSNLHFVDAKNANFALQETSPFKNAGIAIEGITEKGVKNPDLCALEVKKKLLSSINSSPKNLTYPNINILYM